MSALPPYNPGPGENLVFLLPVTAPSDLPASLPPHTAGWTAAFVDDPALSAPVAVLCPGCEPEVVSGSAGPDVPVDGWTAVIGQPAFVEGALRRVMGMPAGTARFVVRVRALSIVQLLPGRAILKHLNAGYALTDLEA